MMETTARVYDFPATRVEQYLDTLRSHYSAGVSGHAPQVARAIAASIGFVVADARANGNGTVAAGDARRALIHAAESAATNAAELDARVENAYQLGAIALDTFLAAWAASTADELRRIQRSLETAFAADLT